MGCHTWFYKRLNITEQQARIDAMYICESQIAWNKEYIDNPLKEIDWSDDVADTKLQIQRAFKFFSRCLSLLKEGYFKFETLSRFYDYVSSQDYNGCNFLKGVYNFERRTNSIYISTHDLPGNIFRVGKYPDDKLISLQETLDFIKNHECYINHPLGDRYDTWEKINVGLIEFWSQYPDGMIDFG